MDNAYDQLVCWMLEHGKEALCSKLLNIDAEDIEFIKPLLPEAIQIGSSDFPIRVREEGGREYVLLLGLHTRWDPSNIRKMAGCYPLYEEKFNLPVSPHVVLLLRSDEASEIYKDDYLQFRFDLTRLWELPAEKHLDMGVEMLPFLVLMEGGLEVLDKIEQQIHSSPRITREEKSRLFTGLAIFSGLLSKEAAAFLVARRKEIMIESPFYHLIS